VSTLLALDERTTTAVWRALILMRSRFRNGVLVDATIAVAPATRHENDHVD